MTEMFQCPKCLSKNDRNISLKKTASESEDVFTDFLAQSICVLWPIITLKVTIVAFAGHKRSTEVCSRWPVGQNWPGS